MNRRGHVGMTLLAFAPVAYVLVSDGNLVLALLCWLGIQAIEPLPDSDFGLPGLSHRGVSHSLLAVLVVGSVLGAGGWLLGDRLFDMLSAIFAVGGDLWDWLLSLLPDLSASILAGMVPSIPPNEIIGTIQQQAGGSVDRWAFATFGFFVGAFGILAHLLGDVITTQGIKPFVPLSRWRLSLSSLRADSPIANSGLFGLGVLAIVVVLTATVPGAVLGATGPAALSPVGVAGAQDSGAQNGSVQINESRTNRTQVGLESVTLPQNGFIVAQTGNVSGNQSGTVVGHTQYVRNGTFEDVVLDLNETVDASNLSVTLYNDSTGDETLNITEDATAETDTPYRTADGTPIRDSVQLGAAGSETASTTQSQSATSANATVSVSNQTIDGSNVTVERVTLPMSGFLVLDLSGAGVEGMLEEDAVAVSEQLSSGTHRNVTLSVNQSPPGGVANRSSLNNTGNYEVVAYEDSNNNSRFEYLTGTSVDQPLVVGSGEEERVVADSARLTIRGSPGDPSATPAPSADIQFADQQTNEQTNGSTLTVESVTLPQGGFVVVHNESYLQEGTDPVTSVVGLSDYLSPGTHQNVPVELTEGSIQQNQTVVAVPSRDTNDTETYDYADSDGFHDVPYTADGEVITDQAAITLGSSSSSSSPSAQSSSNTTTDAATTGEAESGSGGDGWFGMSWPMTIALLAGIIVLPTVVRRLYD